MLKFWKYSYKIIGMDYGLRCACVNWDKLFKIKITFSGLYTIQDSCSNCQ